MNPVASICAMSKNHKSSASDIEAEFLAEQSKLARQAISTVLGEMERNLLRSADVRAWAARYPWPTAAAAVVAGAGAGVAVKSMLPSNGKATNGAAAVAGDRIPEVRVEVGPKKSTSKKPGTLASGLRWLATGLATAAAEALIATTRQQVEAALKQPQVKPPNGEPSLHGGRFGD
jgi:hypothetical protein